MNSSVPTPDFVMLAERATACSRWRWMPGMRVMEPLSERNAHVLKNTSLFVRWGRIVVVNETSLLVALENGATPTRWSPDSLRPDLLDPATLGCLLALVWEAWGPCWVEASLPGPHMVWQLRGVWPRPLNDFVEGAIEAEALVNALESKP